MEKQFCLYYQAHVNVTKTWFVVGMMRNEDHVAFERTLSDDHTIVEFFVPQDQEEEFIHLLHALRKNDYVYEFEKLDNRIGLFKPSGMTDVEQ